MTLTTEQRQEYAKALDALDAREAAIEAARKPIDEQLKPFIEQAMQVEEEREALIDKFGAEFVGKCEECGTVLLSGDQGSRPYSDEDGIVFCAKHGLTYGDVQGNWNDMPSSEDDEDQAENRAAALGMVEAHLAAGGSLADLVPTYEL